MKYYNYHAIVKNKIETIGVFDYEIVKNYNNISPALIIYFNDGTKAVIREHKFLEYISLIDNKNKNGK